jgi:hypothetical protein
MEYYGELKGFPTEVIEKMLERQVEQGNPKKKSIFERNYACNAKNGGFDWDRTTEGQLFWCEVLREEKFKTFFDKYPKKKELAFPRKMLVWDIEGKGKVETLVLGIFPERCNPYKVIGVDNIYKFAEELPEPTIKSETELKAEELIAKANELLQLAEQLKISMK